MDSSRPSDLNMPKIIFLVTLDQPKPIVKTVCPLHTYLVCLLFDSINAVQVRVSNTVIHWTGPSRKLIGSDK